MNCLNLRLITHNLYRIYRPNRICDNCKFVTKTVREPSLDETEENGSPLKYSTSRAAKHKAFISRHGPVSNRLTYEPHVIIASITIFLIYFTMIREENDVDEELGKSLYSRIEGLEELQLKLSLKYNLQGNQSTKDIETRLKEIEIEKQRSVKTQAIIDDE